MLSNAWFCLNKIFYNYLKFKRNGLKQLNKIFCNGYFNFNEKLIRCRRLQLNYARTKSLMKRFPRTTSSPRLIKYYCLKFTANWTVWTILFRGLISGSSSLDDTTKGGTTSFHTHNHVDSKVKRIIFWRVDARRNSASAIYTSRVYL